MNRTKIWMRILNVLALVPLVSIAWGDPIFGSMWLTFVIGSVAAFVSGYAGYMNSAKRPLVSPEPMRKGPNEPEA